MVDYDAVFKKAEEKDPERCGGALIKEEEFGQDKNVRFDETGEPSYNVREPTKFATSPSVFDKTDYKEKKRIPDEVKDFGISGDVVKTIEEPVKWKQPDVFDLQIAKSKLDADNINDLVLKSEMLVVESDEEAQQGVSIGMQARKMGNAIEKTRKAITKPHLDFQRAVKKYADEFSVCLKKMETTVLKKVEAFQEAKAKEAKKAHEEQMKIERAQEEAKRKVEEEKVQAEARRVADERKKQVDQCVNLGQVIPPPPPILTPPPPPPPEPKKEEVFVPPPQKIDVAEGTSTTHVEWVFDIEDPKKIPTEYMMINEKAIKEAVKGGIRSILGVKIYEKKTKKYRVK